MVVWIGSFLTACGGGLAFKKTYKDAARLAVSNDIESLGEAIQAYNEALRYAVLSLDGKYDALKALGVVYLQNKMYLEAIRSFSAAKEIVASDSNLHYYMGLAYANAAEVEVSAQKKSRLILLAEESYKHALKLDAGNTLVYYGLGVLYGFVAEEAPKGIRAFQKALQFQENHVEALFGLGHLYYRVGNTSEAIAKYEKIMKVTSKRSAAHQKALSNRQAIAKGQMQ